MPLPTQHQFAVVGTHVAAGAAAVVATLGFTHIATPDQVANATTAIGQISDGVALIMKGGGTLFGIGTVIYAFIKSGPFASLFRASAAIAADPAKMEQLKTLTVAEQAPLVAVTDRLPDVAGVGTTRTEAGLALAQTVPSPTVQTVQTLTKAV